MDVLNAIALVAERKIEEAIAEGQFDDLPGMGKPLEMEDLGHLPPDMRMAYTILKNSGYLEESKEKKQNLCMKDLLAAAEEEQACYSRMQRLKVMLARVQRTKETLGLAGAGEEQDACVRAEESLYLEKLISRV